MAFEEGRRRRRGLRHPPGQSVIGMHGRLDERQQAGGDRVVRHDRGLGLIGGFHAVHAQDLGDLRRLLVLRDEDGAGDARAQAPIRHQDTWSGLEMPGDPAGLQLLLRLVAFLGLGDPHPAGLARFGRLPGFGHGLLLMEGRAPVRRGGLGVESAQPLPGMTAEHGVDHLQHRRRAASGLVEAEVHPIARDGLVEVAEQLAVAGAPFVEALLQVADHEDASVFVRLADDFADVALEHGELLGAGVLEFIEQPVLDGAVQAVGHLLLVERLGVREQSDVIAEA